MLIHCQVLADSKCGCICRLSWGIINSIVKDYVFYFYSFQNQRVDRCTDRKTWNTLAFMAAAF